MAGPCAQDARGAATLAFHLANARQMQLWFSAEECECVGQ